MKLRKGSPDKEQAAEAAVGTSMSQIADELEAERARSQDYLKRLQYLQADFENYRKRVEREIGDAKRYGNERLLLDLLLVADEMELAIEKAKERSQGENEAILEGVGMVLKRLQSLMLKEGVSKIESLGAKFDPDLHEAALRVPAKEETLDGTIVEEIRSGYTLKGRVLRPSIVKVAEGTHVENNIQDRKEEVE